MAAHKIQVFLVMGIIVSILCCKSAVVKSTELQSPQEELERAIGEIQAKKYSSAIKILEEIIFNYPATPYAVEAQYYLAEAYFQKKNYIQAIAEYEFFINNFSTSRYLEDVYYKLAVCYLKAAPSIARDPQYIQKSWETILVLEENFPNTKYASEIQKMKNEITNLWAKKYYDIGVLYYRGGENDASRVYFDYVINEYPTTKWAQWSKFMIAQILKSKDS
ncbi:MAG: outer membrane protein assembly factor BamD, partial [candidate division WOR-3 bacterium]|nr:outer membrane protein assembly factor BamD [candidate division WOR-3 bacterium]